MFSNLSRSLTIFLLDSLLEINFIGLNKIKRSSDCAPIFPRLKLPLQSLNLLPLVEPHWNYRLKNWAKSGKNSKCVSGPLSDSICFHPFLVPHKLFKKRHLSVSLFKPEKENTRMILSFAFFSNVGAKFYRFWWVTN